MQQQSNASSTQLHGAPCTCTELAPCSCTELAPCTCTNAPARIHGAPCSCAELHASWSSLSRRNLKKQVLSIANGAIVFPREVTWHHMWLLLEICFDNYAVSVAADQPAHLHSLISYTVRHSVCETSTMLLRNVTILADQELAPCSCTELHAAAWLAPRSSVEKHVSSTEEKTSFTNGKWIGWGGGAVTIAWLLS